MVDTFSVLASQTENKDKIAKRTNMQNMSFKTRYLGEATGPEIQQGQDFVAAANAGAKKATPAPAAPTTPNVASPIAPQQSYIKAAEATKDFTAKTTDNDAQAVDNATKSLDIRNDRMSSLSKGVSGAVQEATIFNGLDINARIPGRFDNGLTAKLKNAGIDTGMKKSDFSATDSANKAGENHVTQGTKTSFGLGRSDLSRNAKDGLKTAQNAPGSEDVMGTMTLNASTYFKIGKLVEEYTTADVENSSKGPVKHAALPKGSGVQPGNHSNDMARMNSDMNAANDDSNRMRAATVKATMPEPDIDPAATKTTGLKMSQYGQKYATDSQNAQTSAQREERLGAGQEE